MPDLTFESRLDHANRGLPGTKSRNTNPLLNRISDALSGSFDFVEGDLDLNRTLAIGCRWHCDSG
jgi:hypothetical protein